MKTGWREGQFHYTGSTGFFNPVRARCNTRCGAGARCRARRRLFRCPGASLSETVRRGTIVPRLGRNRGHERKGRGSGALSGRRVREGSRGKALPGLRGSVGFLEGSRAERQGAKPHRPPKVRVRAVLLGERCVREDPPAPLSPARPRHESERFQTGDPAS